MKKKVRELMATLKAYRAGRGLSQRKLAAELGIHWRTYQSWEMGDRYPSAASLLYIAQFIKAAR